MAKAASNTANEPTFEAALKQLEGLVAKLESPETPLETVIATFAEGQKLLKVCQKRLDAAEISLEEALAEGKTKEVE